MKHVSLLRHAKSSWNDPDKQDFDRPLHRRGEIAAALIGAFMARKSVCPDIVLCSSARRTRDTLSILAGSLGRPKRARILDTLYLASAESIFAQIHALPESDKHVLVIGHNPGLAELAVALADARCSDQRALERMARKYPTAALACFESPAPTWRDIALGEARLVSFTLPRDLK